MSYRPIQLSLTKTWNNSESNQLYLMTCNNCKPFLTSSFFNFAEIQIIRNRCGLFSTTTQSNRNMIAGLLLKCTFHFIKKNQEKSKIYGLNSFISYEHVYRNSHLIFNWNTIKEKYKCSDSFNTDIKVLMNKKYILASWQRICSITRYWS